uniref:Eukaryotic translation initiation factor 4 gamma 3 n=1 Tax=Canis lupus dingo TaxID=286419 RepID=A0A8C0KNU3_CANLU
SRLHAESLTWDSIPSLQDHALVARQPGPPTPSPYSAHEINKGHPNLAATPPGHASSPGLSQVRKTSLLLRKFPYKSSILFFKTPYPSGQNAGPTTLVYPQAPQTMNSQPQTRSPFFQRPQIQPPRATIPNSSPSIRPGAQTPTAVYQANQHIMMVNHLPMPYPVPQGPQYCIPQYRHSGPPYVGPPQQYPVQPPGPGPFYPGPGPGDFPNAYGTPFYPSQPVYQSAPIIVPTQQQPPPAKREKKTIRIRDPNQGGKDITEEIMSGGGSRNPTPPIGRPTSTPTPPQVRQSETGPKYYSIISDPRIILKLFLFFSSLEEKPKPDPVLKSPSPVLRLVFSGEKKEQAGQPLETTTVESMPELPLPPSPTTVSPLARSTIASPTSAALSSQPIFASAVDDRCEFSSSKEDTVPIPSPISCAETSDPSPIDVIDDDICKKSCSVAPNDIPLISSTNLINEMNGVSETLPATESIVEIVKQEVLPLTLELEILENAPEEMQVECVPAPITPSTVPSFSPSPPTPPAPPPPTPAIVPAAATNIGTAGVPTTVQRVLEEDESLRTCLSEDAKEIQNKIEVEADGQTEEILDAQNLSSRKSPSPGKLLYTCLPTSLFLDSWKPADTEGKKQYDREFLLDFQYMPACIQKPEGLPPISDVVLDKINQPKLPMRTLDPRILPRGPDFTPAFADFGRQTSGGRGVPLLNVGPRRSQPGQRREPRKIITVSVKEDVHLKKAENAWKPSQKRDSQAEDPENIKTQELFRKVRSILNKLTPQMFNQLMKQVSGLTVDTEERLKGVIDLVFEKAIDEPSFSVAYANMCRCLVTLKVPMADKPGNTVNFRKLLLNRCQKEFEKDKADDDVFEKKQKELEAASAPEEKTRLHDELEEAKDKARRRSIGNIKFIGELFKLKMLTEAIMHDCVVKLLKNHDEESLECLCRLLTTIGRDLDFEKAKPRMDQYFNQMEKIVKERKTSSRIRFMLQDVIDLRLCNWVSRRADQGPKTIEQIHKEAKIEEQEEQRKVQQLMTKEKRRTGEDMFCLLSRGSMGREKNDKPLPSPAARPNTFMRGGSSKDLLDNQSQEEQRREMLETVKQLTGGMDMERNSAETDRNRARESVVKPEIPATSTPALSELEMERKSKSIIDEFLHINDFKEAMQCVEELNAQGLLHVFVRMGVESTLERSQITRDHMGQLLYQLVQSEKLSKQDIFKGFSETLELADDMAIDIPHIWLYLAELVTPMLKEGGISMRELIIEFSKPLLPVGRAGVLLSEILHLLCKQMSHKKVGALWREADLTWKDFLPEGEDVHNFLLEQKLDFIESDSSCSSEALSKKELSAEELYKRLEKLIIEDKANDEQIFDWVEANLDESQMSSPTFLRALMTAVCKAAIIADCSTFRVDTAVIKQRVPILLKYLDSDTEKELQALYALQASIVKLDQPANLLRMFFDCLYDEEVISEDAFYKWESSKDPAEESYTNFLK